MLWGLHFTFMNRKLQVYLVFVIAVALVLLPFQDWHAWMAIPREHLIGVAALICLGLISEILSVGAVVGNHQASASIAFLPFFACILLFPPSAAVVVTISTSLSAQLLVHKKTLLRTGFNAAQTAISIAIGGMVYSLFGGGNAVVGGQLLSLTNLAALAALAITFFTCNQFLVSIAIALSTGNRLATVFSRMVAPGGANFLYDTLVSPVALIVAILYINSGVPGLIIVSLPLLIIRHSYVATQRLQHANKDLLSVLVKTIETRDPYTSGHSIRVSILARAIAEDMNLSATLVDRIETAAIVHDIGKVDAVYASIIRKDGSLSDAERKVIVTHAAKGAEFLETLSSFRRDVVSGVRHHHERYDGTGYPDGLTGESIPLAARIIQLCDSIDAMLSDRPYRKALTVEHVRSELVRCAGTQFDPKIVDIILKKNTLERAAALVRPEKHKPQLLAATA